MIVLPLSGVISAVMSLQVGAGVELALIGWEGMTNGSILAGVDSDPHEAIVRIAGHGLRIEGDVLIRCCEERPLLRTTFARWMHVLSLQTAQTFTSTTMLNVDAQLARWLLMCQDRIGGNEIALTHEFLASALAVRRSTITLTTHKLEGEGYIRATRGLISIRDRRALKALVGSAYGIPEREYERLIAYS